MANPEHLKILKQGVEAWNEMWIKNPNVQPSLIGADLRGVNLEGIILNDAKLEMADLTGANFQNAKMNRANLNHAILEDTNFTQAELYETNFSYAKSDTHGAVFTNSMLSLTDFVCANLKNSNFERANLIGAKFWESNFEGGRFINADFNRAELIRANFKNSIFTGASMRGVDFSESDFSGSIFSGVDFTKARLDRANFSNIKANRVELSLASVVETNLTNGQLTSSRIYGLSAWNIQKDGLIQKDLIITPPDQPEITVDDLEVAQFIYLMLNNQKIRDVIETITSKAVLILGRFTLERKAVLDAIKDELRLRNYLPIVFDFENVSNKSIDETLNLLARMSRFVIADITDAKSIPQELRGFVPDNPSVPIVPLIWKAQREYGMFDHFRNYPWVLPLHEYESPEQLMNNIIDTIIAPVEQKVLELKNK